MTSSMDLALDGNAVHALRHAPRAGRPTLLFLHGAGLDHMAWLPLIERLAAQGYELIAPDLPGHGHSGGAPLANIPAMAAWTLRLLDAMEVGTVTLVGHSMGAMVALECAGADGLPATAGAPPRITGLCLLATAVPLGVSPALLETSANDEPRAQVLVNGWSHATPRPGEGEFPPALAAVMAANLACMHSQRQGVLHADLLACNNYAAGLERAAQVRCPALLLLGEKDRMTPPHGAQALAAALREHAHTRVITLPGSGHNLMGERPDAVAGALAAMLLEHPGTA